MTHSIISLGKAFPLDSLQRAAVSPVGSVGASKYLRPFKVATGDPYLCTLAPGKLSWNGQLVRLFQLAKMTN